MSKETGEKNAKTVDGKSDYGNAWYKVNSDCVGPYKLRNWTANDVVILEANDNYYGKKPGLKRVLIRHVPESGAERLQLEKGDIDMARVLNGNDLAGIEAGKAAKVVRTPRTQFYYITFNMNDPILSNAKVRQAVKYMVDYDALEKTTMKYEGRVRQSLVPIGAFGAMAYTIGTFGLKTLLPLLRLMGDVFNLFNSRKPISVNETRDFSRQTTDGVDAERAIPFHLVLRILLGSLVSSGLGIEIDPILGERAVGTLLKTEESLINMDMKATIAGVVANHLPVSCLQ